MLLSSYEMSSSSSLHAFPQAPTKIVKKPVPNSVPHSLEREVLPLQPRRRLSNKRKDVSGSRDPSPAKTSPLVRERSLSTSASVPSLRAAAAAAASQQAITGIQPIHAKLSGLAGARQKARDVWQRRKGSGSDMEALTTVVEYRLDSPTVPGREMHHKRSESANGWRQNAFGAAMISSLTPPPRLDDLNLLSPLNSQETPRSRSPLGLPPTTAPTSAPPNPPTKEVDTPPAVPPKTPPPTALQHDKSFFLDKSPSVLEHPRHRSPTPTSSPKGRYSPQPPARPESPTLVGPKMPLPVIRQASPVIRGRKESSKTSRPSSPQKEVKIIQITNTPRCESPMLLSSPQIFSRRGESPAPQGLNIRRERSPISPPRVKMIVIPERKFEDPRKCPQRIPAPAPSRPRAESAPNSATINKPQKSPKPELRVNTSTSSPKDVRHHKRQQSSISNNISLPLPSGVRPSQARINYSPMDIQSIQSESRLKSQKFDILKPKDVDILTRELAQLENRCSYLKIQHQNVRAERKAIHQRMLTYLRTTRVFSQENLLKQEEAMASLDEAIEGWEAKVERAEERRNCVRQKLLEHMAASLAVPTFDFGTPIDRSFTPPATPEKELEQQPENEMITVYALLADVEQEIGKLNR